MTYSITCATKKGKHCCMYVLPWKIGFPLYLVSVNLHVQFELNLCVSDCQEGAGHQVLSAFVEIVFDNSDNRIPVNLNDTFNFQLSIFTDSI